MNLFKKSIAGTSVLALALSVTTVSFVSVSPTAAHAERGGNGKGNGNSNRNRSRSENSRSDNARGGSERGRVARELRGLNAAHANQNALENASGDSMPGKLYVYQQAQQEYSDLAAIEAAAGDKYLSLLALTEDERAALFPAAAVEETVVVEGEEQTAVAYDEAAYDAAVGAALADLAEAEADAQEAETTLQTSLDVLTKGDELSDAALAELNRLLGL